MKIRINLKTPDCLHETAKEYAEKKFDNENPDELSSYDNNKKYYLEDKRDEFMELCETWFSHSEYLTVEIDTDKKEIRVV